MKQKNNLKTPSRIFASLSCESCLRIFLILSRKKEMCVSDISKNVGLSMSATSHQLKRMESAGLLYSVRSGRSICYVFNNNNVTADLFKCLKYLASPKGRLI